MMRYAECGARRTCVAVNDAFDTLTRSCSKLIGGIIMDSSGSSRLMDNGILYRTVVLCAAMSV